MTVGSVSGEITYNFDQRVTRKARKKGEQQITVTNFIKHFKSVDLETCLSFK